MINEKKFFVGIAIATAVLLILGVFFLMRSGNKSSTVADTALLAREDSQKISFPSAAVTLVEFADYQCPACGAYHSTLKRLLSDFEGKLNFVYRNFPLTQHKNSRTAAFAAEAAGEQGKFWEMHDRIFEEQAQWSEKDNAKDIFVQYARDLGLDIDRLKQDMDNSKIQSKINRDFGDGNAVGVNSTPTFFLNGEKLINPGSYEIFKTLIQAAIDKAPLSQAPEEKYHAHFNIKAYINGKAIDFALPTYQPTEERELNPDIHFHDGNGDVVHIHKKGVTIGELFQSWGGSVNQYNGYVNGRLVEHIRAYEPQDLDRILLTNGRGQNVIQKQIDSVPDTACIYSEKCPERGKPPKETCVGGLGSGCDE